MFALLNLATLAMSLAFPQDPQLRDASLHLNRVTATDRKE